MKGRVNRRQTIWVVAASMFATAVLSVSAQGQSQWETSGTNIYYNAGNVGIGTNSPGTRLEVSGQAGSIRGICLARSDTGWAAAFRVFGGQLGRKAGRNGKSGSDSSCAKYHRLRSSCAALRRKRRHRYDESGAQTGGCRKCFIRWGGKRPLCLRLLQFLD